MYITRLFRPNRTNLKIIPCLHRLYSESRSQISKTNAIDDDSTPIKYSTSPAKVWLAKTSRMGSESDRLWYEPYVILVSLTVFMIYFTILREENDVDIELGRSLYSRIDGLEEYQLKLSLSYNQSHGLDTSDILKKLEEIENEKKEKNQIV